MSNKLDKVAVFRGTTLFTGLLLLIFFPTSAAAADVHVAAWSAFPFALLLGSIALLPLVVEHWWHSNRNQALVVAIAAVPVAIYLCTLGNAGQRALWHGLEEYVAFIALLLALYTISGGILISGDIPAHPWSNTSLLAFGAVLANFIGTTGASMVLIRPMLRINAHRKNHNHIPIFFIFVVSNLGGLLTPLGDPPLFLGFLNGVDFFWTMRLWPQWLFVNAVVLTIFYIWDKRAYRHEPAREVAFDERIKAHLRIHGLLVNGPLLAGVLLGVLLQSKQVGQTVGQTLGVGDLTLGKPWGEVLMFALAGLSLLGTRRLIRQQNRFTWGPMIEVMILFLGIFITMVPALAILQEHGAKLGITKPWEFFWLTGILSSGLDNAPTYVTFATLASGSNNFQALSLQQPAILAAISCGAVFMGANTYIGNGPNFMVRSIAVSSGYTMPSFLGYMKYSGMILVPIFVAMTFLFFR